MKAVKLLSAFVFCIILGKVENSSDWMSSLTRYIVDVSPFRQVAFITRLVGHERLSSRAFDELCTKVMREFPAIRLNLGASLERRNGSTPYQPTDYFIKMDATARLFLIVHESLENLPILPSPILIDYLAKISVYQYRPMYLLLFLNRIPSESFEDLLNYAWSKKIYDFTIVELPLAEEPRNLKATNRGQVSPIIHQVNQFKNEYKKVAWSPSTVWFPNKVADMAGHTLKVTSVDAPPFSMTRYNEFREVVLVKGATMDLIDMIAQKMKASVLFLPLELDSSKKSSTARVLHTYIKSQQIDLQAYLSPHYTANIRDRILRTATVLPDYWCPVVPILPVKHTLVSINFFSSYILSGAIVIIFVLLRCLLRIKKSPVWKVINLARLLFAIPVSCKPSNNVERIIFTCLIVLSMAYSNTMYTSITEISLIQDAEMEFRTFEDIDKAGLTPIITTLTLNKTFYNPDRTLENLRRKSIRARFKMYLCPKIAAEQKNVTCLMSKRESTVAVLSMRRRHGRDRIKISEACFWSDGRAFLVGPGSPYRHQFDKIIGRLINAGLIEKLYEFKYNNLTDFQDGDYYDPPPTGHKLNTILLRQRLLGIICFGFTLASCTFVAEILVHRFWRNK